MTEKSSDEKTHSGRVAERKSNGWESSRMTELTESEGMPAAEAREDAAVVRAMYRALEEGDAPALRRRADPEIEWIDPLVARLPFDGTRRGLAGVLRAAFRRDADGAGPRVLAETFLEFGDGVLVVGRLVEEGLVEAGDVEGSEKPFVHECYVEDGRVVRIREYPAQGEGR